LNCDQTKAAVDPAASSTAPRRRINREAGTGGRSFVYEMTLDLSKLDADGGVPSGSRGKRKLA